MAWVLRQIGFVFARAVSMCLRGARSVLHRPDRDVDFTATALLTNAVSNTFEED